MTLRARSRTGPTSLASVVDGDCEAHFSGKRGCGPRLIWRWRASNLGAGFVHEGVLGVVAENLKFGFGLLEGGFEVIDLGGGQSPILVREMTDQRNLDLLQLGN